MMIFPKKQHKFSKAQIFSLAFPSCSNLRNCETCVRTPTSHKEIPHVPFVRLTRIPLRNIKKLRFSQEEAPPKEKKNRNTETLPPPFFCVPKNPCSCEQGYFFATINPKFQSHNNALLGAFAPVPITTSQHFVHSKLSNT